MKPQPPLIFWGNESLSTCPEYDRTPILSALLAAGWPIQAVIVNQRPVTSRRKPSGRLNQLSALHGFELVTINRHTNLEETVARYQAQLGIVASFSRIIPQSIIDRFDQGLVNVHPSLLPTYRGSTPIETAILEGQRRTGVSLIQIAATLDSGPVYAQQAIEVEPQINKLNLTIELGQLAAQLVIENLPEIAAGRLQPQTQDESQASWTKPLKVTQRPLDWTQPAIQLEQQIRSQAGWPGSTAVLANQVVKVLAASVVDPSISGRLGQPTFDADRQLIIINCQPGQLGLNQVQVPGRQPVTASEFYRGYGLGGG